MQYNKYTVLNHIITINELTNSPIYIESGNIILNNENNDLFLQLKIKNISKRMISNISLSVKCYDCDNNSITDDMNIDFMDIYCPNNQYFGMDKLIPLPYKNIYSMEVGYFKKIEYIGAMQPADDEPEACFVDPEKYNNEQNYTKIKKGSKKVFITAAVVCILIVLCSTFFIVNSTKRKALSALKSGEYETAFDYIKELPDASSIIETEHNVFSEKGFQNMISGGNGTLCVKSDGTVIFKAKNQWGECNVSDWSDIKAVSAGIYHTVGLKKDGTVVAVGCENNCDYTFGQCNVDDWNNITAISAGSKHTVGLKSDGTVVAVGNNDYGQCNVSNWTDIVSISAGFDNTVGIKKDGTVVSVGVNINKQSNVSDWTNIIDISPSCYHTVGVKSDGSVVCTGEPFDENEQGQCDISNWHDIVSVATGFYHTVGLTADGTVVAVGNNDYGQCNVEDWSDIVAVSCGYYYTIGLRSDGTVICTNSNYFEYNWDLW